MYIFQMFSGDLYKHTANKNGYEFTMLWHHLVINALAVCAVVPHLRGHKKVTKTVSQRG